MDSHDDATGDLRVSDDVVLPAAALTWRFSRSSGPGGQGVNTADSRVELVVDLAEAPGIPDEARARLLARVPRLIDGTRASVTASEHRSQRRNREAARRRLAAMLREALAPDPPARRPRRPSRGARLRRMEDKRVQSQRKALRRSPSE
ncbi:aminoacyl-tRNA hydrolase [Actinomycetospora endophytica]|uniref:Aminoacyl-tRNA hydrolase n=1 Tax=Actinomycetospora endophytica TaxID=2291215 RepID=A0ABS8P6D3_9PSEU|nr:alternative ribosome rescue aminoacyl-tRNA hydrolase ArfB [Actinomycetospora endophytica]MCD2193477.1 aminoacyl-tRNA hydrolase [Actinomycetospora endophytica]